MDAEVDIVDFVKGATIRAEGPISTEDVVRMLDKMEHAVGEWALGDLPYGNIEHANFYESDPEGMDPEFRDAFLRANEKAQRIDLTPFEYCPEYPENQHQWPHVTIQYREGQVEETHDDYRERVLLGIGKVREVVAAYQDEGIPYFNGLVIYPDRALDWGQVESKG